MKLEEERRQKVEMELQRLKEEFAKRVVEPPAPKPRPRPRIATVYLGIRNPHTVNTDRAGTFELDVSDRAAALDGLDGRARPFGQSNPLVAAGDEKDP